MSTDAAAVAWDAEYLAGRYRDDPPVPFTGDIVAAARERSLARGIYIGCGNGRNLLPMLAAGLDLTGLDVSGQAIGQLLRRRPDLAGRLVTGGLTALPPGQRYELVIGIQVFQHGTRNEAHRHLAAAAARVAPDGLLCVRVNAAATDVAHAHERFEEGHDGSFTVRYLAGPKAGLDIHFFAAGELAALAGERFIPVLPFRLASMERTPPQAGRWSQWEVIWQRDPGPAS